MDEGSAVRELLAWFLDDGTDDPEAIRRGLRDVPAELWPGFSAEAAAELNEQERRPGTSGEPDAQRVERLERKRRLLGEERVRREY